MIQSQALRLAALCSRQAYNDPKGTLCALQHRQQSRQLGGCLTPSRRQHHLQLLTLLYMKTLDASRSTTPLLRYPLSCF